MAKFLIVLTVFFSIMQIFAVKAHAYEKEFTIFDTRKTLPLHDEDPVYRDFYVNIGTDNGVKIGSILAVYRHVPIIDIYRNKAEGDLVVPIGHMKVIQAQKTMSVCRVASIASEKQIPVVQYETVMMGDQVQLASDDTIIEDAPSKPVEAKPLPKVKKHKKKSIHLANQGGRASPAPKG